MLGQIRDLPSHDARDDIAHPVVITDLFMLIPWGGFAALRRPLSDLFGVLARIGQKHASGAPGNDLVAVKGNAVKISQCAGLDPLAVKPVFCAQTFRRILNDIRPMSVAYGLDLFHFPRRSVQVGDNNKANVRIKFKRLFQRLRRHVPGVVFRVDKHGLAVLVGHGIDACVEGHVAAEDLFFLQRSVVGPCLAIQPLSRQLGGKMQRSRTGRETDGVFYADIVSDLFFNSVDVCANGRYPVR